MTFKATPIEDRPNGWLVQELDGDLVLSQRKVFVAPDRDTADEAIAIVTQPPAPADPPQDQS
ncbi:MAG: hypothetical protein AAGG72_02720 [Pseudomonadota bacterium]